MQLDPKLPLIVSGDFNCLTKPIDVEGEVGFAQKKCPALNGFILVTKLIDSFRYFN